MKRLLSIFTLLLLAPIASAQEAALTTPVTRTSEAKYKLGRFDCNFDNNTCVVSINVQDSGNTTIRYFNVVVPDASHPGATFTGILAAAGTARATETGGAERRANFRILGYLFDNSYFTGVSATTP